MFIIKAHSKTEQGQVTIGRLPEKADVVIPVATGIFFYISLLEECLIVSL